MTCVYLHQQGVIIEVQKMFIKHWHRGKLNMIILKSILPWFSPIRPYCSILINKACIGEKTQNCQSHNTYINQLSFRDTIRYSNRYPKLQNNKPPCTDRCMHHEYKWVNEWLDAGFLGNLSRNWLSPRN